MTFRLKPGLAHGGVDGSLFYPNYWPQQSNWIFGQEALIDTHSWIDPDVDFQALQIQTGNSIVSICGGGCHALAYLTKNPSVVHAIDTNQTQLALLEIKAKAIEHLPDHNAVYQFLGPANHADNLKRYQRHIRRHLSEESSAIWQARDLLGRPRYYYFKNHLYSQGKRDQLLQRLWLAAKFIGIDIFSLCQSKDLQDQQQRYQNEFDKVNQKPWFKIINRIPAYQEIQQRLKRYCQQFLLKENYFTSFYLGLQLHQQSAIPLHLQETQYPSLKKAVNKLHLHRAPIHSFLEQQAQESVDAFQLLDIQDQMQEQDIIELWKQIDRTASTGARVVFRSKHQQPWFISLLEHHLPQHWTSHEEVNLQLHRLEKSCFYNSIFLYQKH